MPTDPSPPEPETIARSPSNARDVARELDARIPGGPEPDEIFAVVSLLYHALRGATACDGYIGDALRSGDRELEQFFRDCRADAHARARRAENLLITRLVDQGAVAK